jgi:hypothetical protein
MTVNKTEPFSSDFSIDATPLARAPLARLYEALCQIPFGTPTFDLMARVMHIVAAGLAADAALSEASGGNRFNPYMDLDDARQRSVDLLEMLERLSSRKAAGH